MYGALTKKEMNISFLIYFSFESPQLDHLPFFIFFFYLKRISIIWHSNWALIIQRMYEICFGNYLGFDRKWWYDSEQKFPFLKENFQKKSSRTSFDRQLSSSHQILHTITICEWNKKKYFPRYDHSEGNIQPLYYHDTPFSN